MCPSKGEEHTLRSQEEWRFALRKRRQAWKGPTHSKEEKEKEGEKEKAPLGVLYLRKKGRERKQTHESGKRRD